MLVVYSSVLKRDNFLRRFSEDVSSAAVVANDLTCNLKSVCATSSEGKLDWSLQELDQAEKNLKELTALVNNLKQNLRGYVGSLVPREEEEKQEQIQDSQLQVEEKESQQRPQAPDQKNISEILSAIKSLKEMKESLNEK